MADLCKPLSPEAMRSVQVLAPRTAEEVAGMALESASRYEYMSFSGVKTKQVVLQKIAETLGFPPYFGQNFDALADALFEAVQDEPRNWVMVLEAMPETAEFTVSMREILFVIFREVADESVAQNKSFHVFYS